jgi:hypothetical protein
MNRSSRWFADASQVNGGASNMSEPQKPEGTEKENDAAPYPVSKTEQNSPFTMIGPVTQILPILGNRTEANKTLFFEAGIDETYEMPDTAIPMTQDDARALVPRYNGMGQHDMLQWHYKQCESCSSSPVGPCAEYFEIISEYAEYEGYAIRGEG